MANDSKVRIINYSWWILGIIGFLIGILTSENEKEKVSIAFACLAAGIFWGWIIGWVIDKYINLRIMKKPEHEQKTNDNEIENDTVSETDKSHPDDMPSIPSPLEHLRSGIIKDENLRIAINNLIEINRKKIYNDNIHFVLAVKDIFGDSVHPKMQ